MEMGDINFATKLRDLVKGIVSKEVRAYHPAPTYGQVVSFDRRALTAMVVFPGSPDPVPVAMGAVQPQQNGQKVRVCPRSGDLFLEDVIGPAFLAGIAGKANVSSTPASDPVSDPLGGVAPVAPLWSHHHLIGPSGSIPGGTGGTLDVPVVTPAIVGFVCPGPEVIGSSVTGLQVATHVAPAVGTVVVQLSLIRGSYIVGLMSDLAMIEPGERTSYTSAVRSSVSSNEALLAEGDILRFEVPYTDGSARGLSASISYA